MEKEYKTYYEKNKKMILSKLRNKTFEEREKLKQYNRNYYRLVRKNNIEFLNKMKEHNNYHNNKKKEANKEIRVLSDTEETFSFKIIIQQGVFIIEF